MKKNHMKNWCFWFDGRFVDELKCPDSEMKGVCSSCLVAEAEYAVARMKFEQCLSDVGIWLMAIHYVEPRQPSHCDEFDEDGVSFAPWELYELDQDYFSLLSNAPRTGATHYCDAINQFVDLMVAEKCQRRWRELLLERSSELIYESHKLESDLCCDAVPSNPADLSDPTKGMFYDFVHPPINVTSEQAAFLGDDRDSIYVAANRTYFFAHEGRLWSVSH